ncbi:MAG: tetraacyldisaccharide 4'-kinase [Betaproteobacteria bacterium]|nr:tetraacyldisaccharide 4'-kinase [Betaproteobacteria bacterium]
MKLSELYWHRITPLHILLWPLSVLYRFFTLLKKIWYWLDIFPSIKLPVPLIVVDSISIGDGGKTPLLLWLVDLLVAQGFRPGIITRGHAENSGPPVAVIPNSNKQPSYDSRTMLLAHLCEKLCPVWIGNDRATVAQALLKAHPECDIVISNDGLLYYRMERDIELVAADFSEQSFGNGLLLPAGPLRTAISDLGKNGIIVTNNMQNYYGTNLSGKTCNMKLINETAYNLLQPEIHKAVSDFRNEPVHIVTDSDNAQWLYDLIQKMNLNAQLHSHVENHRFMQKDIYFADTDTVLMPEENALQCKTFAHSRLWAIPRKAWVNSELQMIVLNKLKSKPTM